MDAATRARKMKYLAEAEEALHLVNLGQTARVFVDQTGERIEYGPTNAAQLQKYVYQLQVQLGLTNAGPMTPWMI